MTMALPESIPLRREPEGSAPVPAEELAWMGVFALLLVLLAVVWRKHRAGRVASPRKAMSGPLGQWIGRMQRHSGQRVTLVCSTRLTPQHSVHEIHWHGRRMLIGCAPQSIQLLSEMPPEGQPDPDAQPAGDEGGMR
ncbi:flagellar biosynthetic protein FliO [Acidovorax anthurii]|uniref:Flagellar biogenesis protein FliO n=2 Tax=Paracidovorax anthurii TaxID=78229 RepID=A0A328YP95_9BURK|nr:flagellar biogenesis protein FliO [Paracidovorax anthurii]